MRSKLFSIIAIGLLAAVFAARVDCRAATLYTLNVTGTLYSVDQESGATTAVIENLAPGSWSGLASSPTDDNAIYALHNPRPPTFDDPQFSSLARLDLDEGTWELFPFFDSAELGVSEVFSTGVAISPESPDVAVVVGTDREIPPNSYIWEVALDSGLVVQPATKLNNVTRIEALTYGLDGTTLFATNPSGELVTIDRANAEVSVLGGPRLTNFITGIAFRPQDGQLFAINGQREDELVTLDANGGLLGVIGPLGITGPEGLAFAGSVLPLDCDVDGKVDAMDLDCANAAGITDLLLDELGILPGDLDGNKAVNFQDFVVLAGNFSRPRGKYTEGDINNSGDVNFADFVILAGNFGKEPVLAVAAVPEPSAGWLILMGGLLVVQLRRRSGI